MATKPPEHLKTSLLGSERSPGGRWGQGPPHSLKNAGIRLGGASKCLPHSDFCCWRGAARRGLPQSAGLG